MLLPVSSPPHRDLPIEWRTETGEFIGQPPQPQPSPPAAATRPTLPPDGPRSTEDLFEADLSPDEHRAATRVRAVIAVLGLIGLGVTWALGGLAAVPKDPSDDGIPDYAVNQVAAMGPYDLTVEAAGAFTGFGTYVPDEEDSTLLVVVVRAEVTAEKTYSVRNAVTLAGVAGLSRKEASRVITVRDSMLSFSLQPDLPERLAYIWELPAGTAVPVQIEVGLAGARWTESVFSFDTRYYWNDTSGPYGQVFVPVEDHTEAPA
jgi:hypothetical protein